MEISAEMDGPVMEWGNLVEQMARLGCEACESYHYGWCLASRPGSMVNIEFLEGCPKLIAGQHSIQHNSQESLRQIHVPF